MISAYNKPYSGGLENVVAELTNYMTHKGLDITVCYESNRNFKQQKGSFTSLEVKPFYIPKIFHRGFYNKIAYSFKSRQTISQNQFDLIHGHGENCFFNSFLRSNVPLIVTFHGTRAMFIPRRDPRNLAAFYAEKVAAQKCDVATACSEGAKKEVEHFYNVSGNKIKVIHNGVDTDAFFPMDKSLSRKQLGLTGKSIIALWVGLSPERKGLFTVIDSLKNYPNIHLLVVGMIKPNTKNVTFLGKVPFEQLRAAYNASDFFFFPTRYEGFPVAPLEAMACGLPVLTSQASNMGEIMKQGVHGFIVGTDSYLDKINLLLHSDLRLKISRECRCLALQYSWANQAEKYLQLYSKVTGENYN